MNKIKLLYISIEGNTRHFVHKLQEYAKQLYEKDNHYLKIELKEISEQSDFDDEKHPFFAFVPTYLDGGNGIDNGVKELMTNVFGEYIDYNKNANYCIGVIGSGNRNFNEQYCLTARRYAKEFNVPFVDNFELRGTNNDIHRIYDTLIKYQTKS